MILEFIKRRWRKDADWLNGNCWYFVSILLERFPDQGLKRYYLPIEGHFIAGDGDVFYDWNGEYHPQERPILWEEVDPLQKERLIRDCVM